MRILESLLFIQMDRLMPFPLAETAGKLKYVDPDCQLIQEAKTLGISFGD
jgi:hypothetical protein